MNEVEGRSRRPRRSPRGGAYKSFTGSYKYALMKFFQGDGGHQETGAGIGPPRPDAEYRIVAEPASPVEPGEPDPWLWWWAWPIRQMTVEEIKKCWPPKEKP